MKRIYLAITILALSTLLLTNAEAGDRRVGGVILGGGTGAIVGHMIGHNAESTIIGATVGGVAGLIIGNELERQRQPVYHPAHVTAHADNYGHRRYDRRHQPVYRDGFRTYQDNRDGFRTYRDNCRKVVTVKRSHHKTKRVVTTICDNNYRHHYKNKFNNRF